MRKRMVPFENNEGRCQHVNVWSHDQRFLEAGDIRCQRRGRYEYNGMKLCKIHLDYRKRQDGEA